MSLRNIILTSFVIIVWAIFLTLLSIYNGDIIYSNIFMISLIVFIYLIPVFIIFFMIKLKYGEKVPYLGSEFCTFKRNFYTFIVVLCTFLSVFIFLFINKKYNQGISKTETYVVTNKKRFYKKFYRIVKYKVMNVKNKKIRTYYDFGTFKYGKVKYIRFQTRKGFLGFDYLDINN